MIAHTSLPVSDYKKAKEFYIEALVPLGYKQNMEYGEAAGFMEGWHTSFWIGKEEKGVVPSHVAKRVAPFCSIPIHKISDFLMENIEYATISFDYEKFFCTSPF